MPLCVFLHYFRALFPSRGKKNPERCLVSTPGSPACIYIPLIYMQGCEYCGQDCTRSLLCRCTNRVPLAVVGTAGDLGNRQVWKDAQESRNSSERYCPSHKFLLLITLAQGGGEYHGLQQYRPWIVKNTYWCSSLVQGISTQLAPFIGRLAIWSFLQHHGQQPCSVVIRGALQKSFKSILGIMYTLPRGTHMHI